MNTQRQSPAYKELAINLKSYLEKKENKKLERIPSGENYKWDIHPIDSEGDCNQEKAQPTLIYGIDKTNNVFIISSICLSTQRKGIGSEIIKIITEFCRNNNISKIYIQGVNSSNKKMIDFCKKHNFNVYKTVDEINGQYTNWEKIL